MNKDGAIQASQTIPMPENRGEKSIMSHEYMNGNVSIMSGGSGLPDLKKINRSLNRGAANNLSSAGSGNKTFDSNQKLRKASPEALALMMANKKKNDSTSQSSSHWVPGGSSKGANNLKRDNSRQRKLFY